MHGISPEEYEEFAGSTPSKAPRRAKRAAGRVVSLPVALAIGVVLALVGASAAVATTVAATGFKDVPDNHAFADEISWMARTGIAEGYPDDTYRPTAPVYRQTMAAFMQRLFDLQEDMGYATRVLESSTSSTSFVDIPGMTTTVVVPKGTWANIYARFSAESTMSGIVGTSGSVRLMISWNGGAFNAMDPNAGADAAFDSISSSSDFRESHMIERVTWGQAGTYTIKAQYAVTSGSSTLTLDDMTLVAETDLESSQFFPF